MAPADDDVAAGGGVAVVAEIAAFKFEFDVDALPTIGSDLALGFVIGEAGLHGFDDLKSGRLFWGVILSIGKRFFSPLRGGRSKRDPSGKKRPQDDTCFCSRPQDDRI